MEVQGFEDREPWIGPDRPVSRDREGEESDFQLRATLLRRRLAMQSTGGSSQQ